MLKFEKYNYFFQLVEATANLILEASCGQLLKTISQQAFTSTVQLVFSDELINCTLSVGFQRRPRQVGILEPYPESQCILASLIE